MLDELDELLELAMLDELELLRLDELDVLRLEDTIDDEELWFSAVPNTPSSHSE